MYAKAMIPCPHSLLFTANGQLQTLYINALKSSASLVLQALRDFAARLGVAIEHIKPMLFSAEANLRQKYFFLCLVAY